MKVKKIGMGKLFGLVLVVVFSIGSAKAQLFPNLGGQRVGISGMPFLKNDLSPRSVAMGGANVSLSGDGYAVSNNVALAAEVAEPTLSISNLNFGAGLNHTSASVFLPTNSGQWIVNVNNLSAGQMELRTEFQPNGTGVQFGSTNLTTGIGYARNLSEMFSFGIMAKYIFESIDTYRAQALAADIGFLYRTDWRNLRFAATLQHFGTNATMEGTYRPVSFNRSGDPLTESYPAPVTFKMGASLDAYKDEIHTLVAAAQLYHPSDNTQNVRLALEYSYLEKFFVRAGYRLNVPNETLPSGGVGINLHVGRLPMRLDYGVQPSNFLGLMQNVGLCIGLGKVDPKKEAEKGGNE